MPILALDQVILPAVATIDQPTLATYTAAHDRLVSRLAAVNDALLALRDLRDYAAQQRDIMAQLVAALPPSA